MTKFSDIDSTIEIDGFTLTARTEHDSDTGAPWVEHDGHGPVSDWTTRAKAPGELILSSDGARKRFYDFAAACATARADAWGPHPYRLEIEQGASGLCRADAHWFEGSDLIALKSDWCDDQNDARADVYAKLRESIGAGRYAAMAARADFERLQGWCDDQWHWCGVVVTVSREGIKLGDASLWGIESDAGAYLADVANELIEQALSEAREAVAGLTSHMAAHNA